VLLGVLARTHLRDSISLSPSVIALAISSAITTTNTITFLTRTIAGLATDMSSTERLRQYTEEIPQERTLKYQGEDDAPVNAPPHPPSEWPASPDVTLVNFNLRYRPGLPLALRDVTVSLKSHNKIGIVGRTGSGKSTLILAIFRIVEALSGCIKIDGRDIATLKLDDLRRVITIIPQDPLLFTGTVRTNIDPFGQHTDDALWAVLDKLRLRPRLSTFITEGPRGLEAAVAERGNNFSAGQRQLLCMARALLKNAPIIMLDEATASLDLEADGLIQTLVRSEFRDKTVITIAHRLATVMDSDRILVMANGEVAEFDSPKTLMRDDTSVLNGMARRLGPEQFTLLRDLAEGRATLSAAALELRTSCD
jgi:ABC-type multidrug transport system fused ATPase/permease subunit